MKRVFGLPDETLGWFAIALTLLTFGLYWILLQLDRWGFDKGGGDTFWSMPYHATVVILMFGCGILGGALALWAIGWRKDRSLLVFGSLLFGIFATYFLIGELVSPH